MFLRKENEMNEHKFDGKGEIYKKYRPDYPRELLDWLYSDGGFSAESVVADVGSGTGIFSRCLLERGSRVFAVEPNGDMRKKAESTLGKYSGFVSVAASAESTGLEENSVDFVTAAQAFHWFDREKFRLECRRILRPVGKVLLLWNTKDTSSELVRGIAEVSSRFCPSFSGFSGGIDFSDSSKEFSGFFSGEYISKFFKKDFALDKERFVGRCLSSSYSLKEGDEGYSGYVSAIENLFDEYSRDGVIFIPNFTCCYMGSV